MAQEIKKKSVLQVTQPLPLGGNDSTRSQHLARSYPSQMISRTYIQYTHDWLQGRLPPASCQPRPLETRRSCVSAHAGYPLEKQQRCMRGSRRQKCYAVIQTRANCGQRNTAGPNVANQSPGTSTSLVAAAKHPNQQHEHNLTNKFIS